MTGSMECPICFTTLRSKVIRLDCNHKICFACGEKWISQQSSCPLCRRHTDYFSKGTRSFTKANLICISIQIIFEASDYICTIEEYIDLLEIFVLRDKYVWYRPDMRHCLSALIRPLQKMTDAIQTLPRDQKKIVQSLLQMRRSEDG